MLNPEKSLADARAFLETYEPAMDDPSAATAKWHMERLCGVLNCVLADNRVAEKIINGVDHWEDICADGLMARRLKQLRRGYEAHEKARAAAQTAG